jgi:hypothetical protein
MARRNTRNVVPSPSNDARDKLLAALNWPYGRMKHTDTYGRAPMYFEMCWEWYQRLSPEDQDAVATIADVMAGAHKDAAEGMAASLPPAPRCPL